MSANLFSQLAVLCTIFKYGKILYLNVFLDFQPIYEDLINLLTNRTNTIVDY